MMDDKDVGSDLVLQPWAGRLLASQAATGLL